MEEAVSSVLANFSVLRSHDNAEIQAASEWLEGYYQSQDSLSVLFQILHTSQAEIMRRYAALGLKQSLACLWDSLSESEQETTMQEICQIILNEHSTLLRSDLATSAFTFMNDRFINIFLPIIIDASATGNSLETAISIVPLLTRCQEMRQNPEIEAILQTLFHRSFEADSIETRLNALQALYNAACFELITDMSDQWNHCLDLFDLCMQNHNDLNVLTSLMNLFIDNIPGLCDFGSLYEKCVGYFYESGVDQQSYLFIFTIIEAICEQAPSFIEQESLYIQVLQVAFSLLYFFFDPTDDFTVTTVQFFELAMRGIMPSEPVLKVLWQICCQVAPTEKGKYAFLCALAGTHERSNGFYEDKAHEITCFLSECLDIEIPCIQEKTAEVICEFAPTFRKNSDSVTRELADKMMHILQQSPTENFISSFTALLSTLQETVSLFGDVFSIVTSLLETTTLSLQSTALPLLSAIIPRGQTKVEEFLPNIVEIIATFLRNEEGEDADLFRVQAVQCLEQLLRAASDSAREQCVELVAFVLENICNEGSPQFALACLSALDAAVEHASFVVPEWTDEVVQYLKGIVSVDLVALFRQVVYEPFSETEDTCTFQEKFITSALALRILARALLDNGDVYSAIFSDIIDACAMMSDSVEEICQKSSCDSASLIAEAALKHNAQNIETTAKLVDLVMNVEKGRLTNSLLLASACALKVIVIDTHSPTTPEMLKELLQTLYQTLFSIPSLLMYDEYILLINDLVLLLVPTQLAELRQFADEAMASVTPENESQYHAALSLMCSVVAASPKDFDANTKTELLQLQNQKIASLETFYSSLFIKRIATNDPAFFTPLAPTSFEALMTAISSPLVDSDAGRRVMHYATVTLIYIVLRILPECFTIDTIDAILSVLPLKCGTGDSALEAEFLVEVFQKSEGQFNPKILIIINEALLGSQSYWRTRELSEELLNALKLVMRNILGLDPQQSVANICGESEALLENIKQFLGENE